VRRARSIAAAQTIPKPGDVDANVDDHARLIRAAADEHAQVLVFPELSLTGYELDLAGDLAFSESDPRLAPLIALASATRMTLVVGAPVRLGPLLHIVAFIVAPDCSVALYTKHHLGAFPADASPDGIVPPAEGTVFHPGDRNPLLRLDGTTAAVAVCADTNRPSHPKKAADRGAGTYLASMFFTPAELEQETAKLRAYAVAHSMAVAAANFGGPSGGLAAGGGSAIWSDTGEQLAQLDGQGVGVAVAVEDESGWRGKALMLGEA
jgi:predicted amidohydrolase